MDDDRIWECGEAVADTVFDGTEEKKEEAWGRMAEAKMVEVKMKEGRRIGDEQWSGR